MCCADHSASDSAMYEAGGCTRTCAADRCCPGTVGNCCRPRYGFPCSSGRGRWSRPSRTRAAPPQRLQHCRLRADRRCEPRGSVCRPPRGHAQHCKLMQAPSGACFSRGLRHTSPEDALCGEEREGVPQFKAHLAAEAGEGAGACPVLPERAAGNHVPHQVQVLLRQTAHQLAVTPPHNPGSRILLGLHTELCSVSTDKPQMQKARILGSVE